MAEVDGGCFCGKVRYRATAAPQASMICHCQSCRRAVGAPVVAWVTFARSALAFTEGEPAYFASSEPVRRGFCAACGTPLTYEHTDRPDSIDITTASLDAPNAFPPTHHSYLANDLTWVRFGDGLPAFPEWRPPG
jgi:hypothetical protein